MDFAKPSTEYHSSSRFERLVILTRMLSRYVTFIAFSRFFTYAQTHTHTHTHQSTFVHTFIQPYSHTHNAVRDAHSIPFLFSLHQRATPQHANSPTICTSRLSSRWADVAWAAGRRARFIVGAAYVGEQCAVSTHRRTYKTNDTPV